MTHLIILSLLVIAAAVLSAVMDTLAFHRSTSVFQKASAFWTVEQGPIVPLTKYRFNAWHLAKSAWIVSLMACWPFYHVVIHPVADIGIAGFVYIQVFNLFFDHIFKRNVTP